jgi:hypothetical protein
LHKLAHGVEDDLFGFDGFGCALRCQHSNVSLRRYGTSLIRSAVLSALAIEVDAGAF